MRPGMARPTLVPRSRHRHSTAPRAPDTVRIHGANDRADEIARLAVVAPDHERFRKVFAQTLQSQTKPAPSSASSKDGLSV